MNKKKIIIALSCFLLNTYSTAKIFPVYIDEFNELREKHPDIMRLNLQKVVEYTSSVTEERLQMAEKDAANVARFFPVISISTNLGYALAGLEPAWNVSYLTPKTSALLTFSGIYSGITNQIAKRTYKFKRPFGTALTAFPSGHTASGYTSAYVLAMILPERYPELMTAAADYGQSRIYLGAHHPLDIIGSRIMVTAGIANLMANPVYRMLLNSSRKELRDQLQFFCQSSINDCINKVTDDAYSDKAANQKKHNYFMHYDFPQIKPLRVEFIAPKNSEYLLITRFPYLTAEQRREVLKSTAIDSGYPLDKQGEYGYWQRINMYEASQGYKNLDQDVYVNMDANLAKDSLFHLGNLNYAYDVWSNPLTGGGRIIKSGSGSLNLSENNQFAGVTVNGGELSLWGNNDFFEESYVNGGQLTVNGSLNSKQLLTIGRDGTLTGSGVINSRLNLFGQLLVNNNAPLTLTKRIKFFGSSRFKPNNQYGFNAPLVVKGKKAHIEINGLLETSDSRPGEIVSLKNNATMNGAFNLISQPRFLKQQGLFYNVLYHQYGINLYIDSANYPKTEHFLANEKRGAELLIRLQGSSLFYDSQYYKEWLNHAWETGELQNLHKNIIGQIHADSLNYLLDSGVNIFNLSYKMLAKNSTNNPNTWVTGKVGSTKFDALPGNDSSKTKSNQLLLGLTQPFNKKSVMSLYLAIVQTKISNSGSAEADLNSFGLGADVKWAFRNWQQGPFIGAQMLLQRVQYKSSRSIVDYTLVKGKTRGSTLNLGLFMGYIWNLNDWKLESSLAYHSNHVLLKEFNEKKSEFALYFDRINKSRQLARLNFELKKDIISDELIISPYANIALERAMTRGPVLASAKLASITMQQESARQGKNTVSLGLGVGFSKNAIGGHFALNGSKGKHSKSSSARFSIKYQF